MRTFHTPLCVLFMFTAVCSFSVSCSHDIIAQCVFSSFHIKTGIELEQAHVCDIKPFNQMLKSHLTTPS